MQTHSLAPPHSAAPDAEPPPDPAWQGWRGPVLVGLIIFCCALSGILSRPINYAAVLWIANPVLAGLMVRHPHLARSPTGWLAALVGFLAADLMTGSSLLTTVWFTCANLAGSGTSAFILLRGKARTRFMQGQHSALLLFNSAFWGAAVSALIASGTGPVLFNSDLLPNTAMWLGGEFMAYILLLPVMLTLPRQWSIMQRLQHSLRLRSIDWAQLLPLISVVASLTVSVQVDNSSALSLVVPALVWCALSYSLLAIALLCCAVCLILTVEVAMGNFQFTPEYWQTAMSLRLGISLLALGPWGPWPWPAIALPASGPWTGSITPSTTTF